jgi:hypothetical protein
MLPKIRTREVFWTFPGFRRLAIAIDIDEVVIQPEAVAGDCRQQQRQGRGRESRHWSDRMNSHGRRFGLRGESSRGAAVVLLAVMVSLVCVEGGSAAGLAAGRGSAFAETRGDVDHLYRIKGKVRFLLFWAGADDVGSARIVRREGDRDRGYSLLIGSEPRRAPRGVNEWGYVRESVAGDRTTIFGTRTVTDGDSPNEADARRTRAGGLAAFGVLCSSVSPVGATSRTTIVYAPGDVTYRDVASGLTVLERDVHWKALYTPRPAGVAPGFLTALDQMMRSSAAAARENRAIPSAPRMAYVYKDAVYDLLARRVERLPQLRLHSGTFRNLIRTDFSIRNRVTGWTTEFRITYGTEGSLAGVPVHAQYQPNWWFRVELELDEGGDAPEDPAGDVSIRQRIDTLCRSSME